jgi:hypothetical protein
MIAGFGGIYPNYTGVLIALGRYEEAVQIALRGATAGGTDKAYLAAEAGRAYEYMGRLGEARWAYRNAYYLAEDHAMMSSMRSCMHRIRRKRMMRLTGFLS